MNPFDWPWWVDFKGYPELRGLKHGEGLPPGQLDESIFRGVDVRDMRDPQTVGEGLLKRRQKKREKEARDNGDSSPGGNGEPGGTGTIGGGEGDIPGEYRGRDPLDDSPGF